MSHLQSLSVDAADAVDMAGAYDAYFASRHYDQRYPAPNPSTWAFLLAQGLHRTQSVLDLGCGNGRYALPLLDAGCASVTGCDLSQAALDSFQARLRGHPRAGHVRLVAGGLEALPAGTRFDVFLLLFGVLGLLGDRAARVGALRQLRARSLPGARLVLTVPSAWRRLPGPLLRAGWRYAMGARMGGTPAESPRDIRYSRFIDGQRREFLYHLYGTGELRRELVEAGWHVLSMEAESVLPESLVCRLPLLGRVDAWLRPWTPAFLGYGIRAVAVPDVGYAGGPASAAAPAGVAGKAMGPTAAGEAPRAASAGPRPLR